MMSDWGIGALHLDDAVKTINGLGTLVVAWLVYQLGRQQNRYSRGASERQYRLEKENLRLALLERRAKVVEAFDQIKEDVVLKPYDEEDILTRVSKVIREAGYVFDDDVQSELGKTLDLVSETDRVRGLRDEARTQGKKDGDLEKQFPELWTQMFRQLIDVACLLKQASRVREPTDAPDTPAVQQL